MERLEKLTDEAIQEIQNKYSRLRHRQDGIDGKMIMTQDKQQDCISEQQRVQLEGSLVMNRSEVMLLEEAIATKCRQLDILERHVETESYGYEVFVKMFEERANDARPFLEKERLSKQREDAAIERLSKAVSVLQRDVVNAEETNKNCGRYRNLLLRLMPPEWQDALKAEAQASSNRNDQNEGPSGREDQDEQPSDTEDQDEQLSDTEDQDKQLSGRDDQDEQDEQQSGRDDQDEQLSDTEDQDEQLSGRNDQDEQDEQQSGRDDQDEQLSGRDDQDEQDEQQSGRDDQDEQLSDRNDQDEQLSGRNDQDEQDEQLSGRDDQDEQLSGRNDQDEQDEQLSGRDDQDKQLSGRNDQDEQDEQQSGRDDQDEQLSGRDDQDEQLSDTEDQEEQQSDTDSQDEELSGIIDQSEQPSDQHDQSEQLSYTDDQSEQPSDREDCGKEPSDIIDQSEQLSDTADQREMPPGTGDQEDHNDDESEKPSCMDDVALTEGPTLASPHSDTLLDSDGTEYEKIYLFDSQQLLELMKEVNEQNLYLIDMCRLDEEEEELHQEPATPAVNTMNEVEMKLVVREFRDRVESFKMTSEQDQLQEAMTLQELDAVLDPLGLKVTDVHYFCTSRQAGTLSTLDKLLVIKDRVTLLLQNIEKRLRRNLPSDQEKMKRSLSGPPQKMERKPMPRYNCVEPRVAPEENS